MKLSTTIRNLMMTMLVLGIAGSVIGVGTFAQFNAVTNNPSNTFAAGQIVFSNTVGSTTCTGQSGTSSGVASGCATLVTIPSSMVPGDSKLGLFSLSNVSTSARAVTLAMQVSATASSALDANSIANTATSGLGLLVFQCTNGGSPVVCTNNPVTLTQVYPSTSTCSPGSIATAGGLTTSKISTLAVSNTQSIQVNGVTCTGGNVTQASAQTIAGTDTVATGQTGLATGTTDNLATIVYLPSVAGNSMSNLTSTLNFTWTATQVNGTSQ
jgi:predicted ribosomally synthesized peptide with SipW-like signal peptide